MSYHYEFDGRSRTLLSVVEGRIDDSELEELYFGIRKLKYKDNALTGILDLTSVTDFDVRSETVRGLAHLPAIFEDPTLRAVIAPTDLLFGMARMFQIRGSETREELYVVRTLNEALALLGVSSPHFLQADAA
jgi:hypothetical protein